MLQVHTALDEGEDVTGTHSTGWRLAEGEDRYRCYRYTQHWLKEKMLQVHTALDEGEDVTGTHSAG